MRRCSTGSLPPSASVTMLIIVGIVHIGRHGLTPGYVSPRLEIVSVVVLPIAENRGRVEPIPVQFLPAHHSEFIWWILRLENNLVTSVQPWNTGFIRRDLYKPAVSDIGQLWNRDKIFPPHAARGLAVITLMETRVIPAPRERQTHDHSNLSGGSSSFPTKISGPCPARQSRILLKKSRGERGLDGSRRGYMGLMKLLTGLLGIALEIFKDYLNGYWKKRIGVRNHGSKS
jgi:hypothetical protein